MEDKKPKLRFNGFAEDWKKKRLDEIIQLNSGMDYKCLEDGDIPVYGTGGYMLNVNKALSYNDDAIGIGRKGTIDKPFILKAPFWTVDTLFYAIPQKDNDLQFCNCEGHPNIIDLKIIWDDEFQHNRFVILSVPF